MFKSISVIRIRQVLFMNRALMLGLKARYPRSKLFIPKMSHDDKNISSLAGFVDDTRLTADFVENSQGL